MAGISTVRPKPLTPVASVAAENLGALDNRGIGQVPVRIALRRRPRPRPTVEERVALRFPRAVGAVRRLIFRLPPSSRARQGALARAMQLGFASYERGDFEMVPTVFYSPDVTLHTALGPVQEVPLDLPSPVHGIEGVTRWLQVWHEPFSAVRFELRDFYDGGDWGLFVIDQFATGRASGIEIHQLTYSAMRWEGGRVVWQLVTWSLDEAMGAAGFEALPEPETSA